MKYKGILASSSDPSGGTMSKTVDGVVTILAAVLPMLALSYFHVQISAADVGSLVTEVATIVGAILTIRGTILKVINTYGTVPDTADLG